MVYTCNSNTLEAEAGDQDYCNSLGCRAQIKVCVCVGVHICTAGEGSREDGLLDHEDIRHIKAGQNGTQWYSVGKLETSRS